MTKGLEPQVTQDTTDQPPIREESLTPAHAVKIGATPVASEDASARPNPGYPLHSGDRAEYWAV
jgi:hypothetical protein